MNRLIEIDWAEVKSVSNKFLNNSSELSKIADDFSSEVEKIKENWKGIDSENYISNFDEIVSRLKEEAEYLNVWNDYLSKSSSKYNENVDNILLRLQSIDNDIESIK